MSLIEKIDELERHLVKNNCYFEGAEWLFGKAREAILSQQKEPIGNTEQLKEIIKKIDEEIAMYQQRIDNRNGACYHDESERVIRFEERLHEAERIKEIILSEQKEPIGNTEQFKDEPMLLSEFLYKCIATNDLIYCNTMDEDGGFMMRGNDWNTETANKYYITRVSINSGNAIQCRLCEID